MIYSFSIEATPCIIAKNQNKIALFSLLLLLSVSHLLTQAT